MKLKLPTMYDVAKLAGVSQPTVSRVLNDTSDAVLISDQTRQRVLAAVEQLGYRRNAIARSLRTQRTHTIALQIADISNSFYHPIARAVQDVARQYGYEVLISNSDHLYEHERHFCEFVLSRAVDGVIMVPIHMTAEELDDFASKSHMPFVVLGQHIDHPHIDKVFVDDERATYEAACWLISQGYSTIGYIGVPDFYPPGPRRLRGFTKAMHDSRLSIEPHFVEYGDFTLEGGRAVARRLVERGSLPSAFMVANDLMAIGLMLQLQELGVRIPQDVAVIGFDNIPETTIVRPALTTIAMDPRDIGEKLATTLFERIADPGERERRLFVSTYEIIARQST